LLAHIALDFCKPAAMSDVTNRSWRLPDVTVSLTARSKQYGSEGVECSEGVFTIHSSVNLAVSSILAFPSLLC